MPSNVLFLNKMNNLNSFMIKRIQFKFIYFKYIPRKHIKTNLIKH